MWKLSQSMPYEGFTWYREKWWYTLMTNRPTSSLLVSHDIITNWWIFMGRYKIVLHAVHIINKGIEKHGKSLKLTKHADNWCPEWVFRDVSGFRRMLWDVELRLSRNKSELMFTKCVKKSNKKKKRKAKKSAWRSTEENGKRDAKYYPERQKEKWLD